MPEVCRAGALRPALLLQAGAEEDVIVVILQGVGQFA